ncbi:MAG TPA: tetratricopeptide repeat protein [Ferruginibacter sp.]|nr:tetratricopeptide repeat protein [Ferruginibacter sp.]HRE65150.1 tetratricopeptide repeat protein [Ferruginibacter sp.]
MIPKEKTLRIAAAIFLNILFGYSAKSQNPYFELTNLAELQFIDGNYRESLKSYNKAFALGKNSFGKDLYNAALCSIRIGDLLLCNNFLDSLCARGYKLNKLNKKHFSKFHKSKYYKALSKKYQNFLINEVLIKNNEYLQGILKDDQYFRLKNPGNYRNTEFVGIIGLIDSINAYKLLNFIETKGFPSEFTCGIDETSSFYNFASHVILMHQAFGSKSRVINFTETVLNAMEKGQVLPHIGTSEYVISSRRDSLFGRDYYFRVKQDDGTYIYAYLGDTKNDKESWINTNRKRYNLEPLADYRKKILYWIKNDDLIFDFIMGEDVATFSKSMIKHFKNIKYIE